MKYDALPDAADHRRALLDRAAVTTQDFARTAIFAALTAALGLFPPIFVPFLPVPITLQSMGPMLAGSLLAPKVAGASQLVFVALVAMGFPLLAGGRGGFGALLAPNGGFLLAFPLAAWTVSVVRARMPGRDASWSTMLSCVVGGLGVVYLVGVPFLAMMGDLTWSRAVIGSLIFVPGDLAKAVIAGWSSTLVRRTYLAETVR